ncbi:MULTISPECIES: hypothetical protein [unclassified Burkholderia]|uniref:hypothetical protein n=1 Tax=unclassified Burkholderia TaxID=2613784 RepID=UPI001E31EC78|nr:MULTISPECIES: hypothetical protein [unclassified Burkholderia]UEP28128.1 hypothetical protein LMA01_01470 [Burkholderia sp. B21-007]UEP41629.1 hypothetical protein LMA02_01275 [Burkholderia sp. B21-005]
MATASAMAPDAITCAWLQNDASTYRIAAGSDDDASQGDTDSSAGFDVSQLLIRDDLRTRAWLPHQLRVGVAANGQQCKRALRRPSCQPTNVSAWSPYRSEAALCTRNRRVDTMHALFS